MFVDFGIHLGIELLTDASAAKGIAMRIGLGKVRHLEASRLWIQSKVVDGTIRVTKADGNHNKADTLTKYLTGPQLSEHVGMVPVIRLNKVHETSIGTTNS